MSNVKVETIVAQTDSGEGRRLTVTSEVIDNFEVARAFGGSDLIDQSALSGPRGCQRRLLAVPDRRAAVVAPMLLTIGNANDLGLVRRSAASPTGWAHLDLSAGLAGARGGAVRVQAIGAAWTADDRIAVAVAVADGADTTRSRVLVAYDLSSATSDWAKIAWIDCGTRDAVEVEGIRVVDNGNRTWTTVLLGKSDQGQKYYLLGSRTRNPTFAAAAIFTTIAQGEGLPAFDVGVLGGKPGLYVAAQKGGKAWAAFSPFPTLGADGWATKVPLALPLRVSGNPATIDCGLTSKAGTDVYYGGAGVYTVAAADQRLQTAAPIQMVASPKLAADVRHLEVSERPDGGVAV